MSTNRDGTKASRRAAHRTTTPGRSLEARDLNTWPDEARTVGLGLLQDLPHLKAGDVNVFKEHCMAIVSLEEVREVLDSEGLYEIDDRTGKTVPHQMTRLETVYSARIQSTSRQLGFGAHGTHRSKMVAQSPQSMENQNLNAGPALDGDVRGDIRLVGT